MSYGVLVTQTGQGKLAAFATGGDAIELTSVAVGDANGVPYDPSDAQTDLVHEVWRGAITSLGTEAGGIIVVECTIPADTNDSLDRPSHGFRINELGVFDATGALIAVAKMSGGLKPSPSSGQAEAITVQIKIDVGNADATSVTVEPAAKIHVARLARVFWLSVDAATVAAPPADPVAGATYIVPVATVGAPAGAVNKAAGGATGLWAGQANRLAQWVGSWVFADAPLGSLARLPDGSFVQRADTSWVVWTPLAAHTHPITDITGLQAALDGKAATAHTHAQYLRRDIDDTTIGSLTMRALVTNEGALVGGDLTVNGGATVGGKVVSGSSRTTGDAEVNGGLTVAGAAVIGAKVKAASAEITGNATVGGTLGATGKITGGAGAAITGATTITGTLDASGKITGGNGAAITGATTITGDLTASGKVKGGSAEVTGNATVGGALSVAGKATVGSAEVTGNATVGGALAVTGTFGATGKISGGSGADITGPVVITGAMTATGKITGGAGAAVTGLLDVAGDVAATGKLKGGSAEITGNATVGGTLAATGKITGAAGADIAGFVRRAGVDLVDTARALAGSSGLLIDGAANATKDFSVNRSLAVDPAWVNGLIAAAMPAGKIIAIGQFRSPGRGAPTAQVAGGALAQVAVNVSKTCRFTFGAARPAANYIVLGLSLSGWQGATNVDSVIEIGNVPEISNKLTTSFDITPPVGNGGASNSTTYFIVME